MRRIFMIMCLMCLLASQAHCVLKEKDLYHTLLVLESELESYHNDLETVRERSKDQRKQLRQLLDYYLEEANQVALMVYSQQQDYIFDLTYACHQATELYSRFHSNHIPFDTLMASLDIEVERYNGLVSVLNDIKPDSLDVTKMESRAKCLRLAGTIHRELMAQQDELAGFQEQYNKVESQLSAMRTYARNRYKDVQGDIFENKGYNYFTLLKNILGNKHFANNTWTDKYSSYETVDSQWRGSIILMVFGIMLVYGLVATLIGFLIWRYLLPRLKRIRNEFDSPFNSVVCFAMTTFAIVVGVVNMVVEHNFIKMATGLMVQFAWLVAAIQLSMIIRLPGEQERIGIRVYAPVLLMGLIVIMMRAIFIPSVVIALYFPPLLAVASVWQWREVSRRGRLLPKSDSLYAWITFVVMLTSLLLSCIGRTLMAVEVFIWWMMQLTCIQTITCLYDLLDRYENHAVAEGANIRSTWCIDLINKTMLPIMGIFSFLFSIYWSADVFDMSEWVVGVFLATLIDVDGVIELSLWRVCIVAGLFFVARYVMYFVRENLKIHFSAPGKVNGQGAIVIGNNVASIIIWGGYLIISMLVLHIGNSWVLVITGGLSTGIGFALKDTLENFFYGVSLMLGRLHIGDIIECDGVRGTVSYISYQSTTIQTVDGSEMAFLNSQLFSKNFKNMTRNNNLELVIIPVGVAYGTDVEHVRRVLIHDIEQLACFDREKGVSVGFMDFGASSVDLKVCVWVDARTKGASVAEVKEVIYNALNSNGIEIPFPQLDIHQR